MLIMLIKLYFHNDSNSTNYLSHFFNIKNKKKTQKLYQFRNSYVKDKIKSYWPFVVVNWSFFGEIIEWRGMKVSPFSEKGGKEKLNQFCRYLFCVVLEILLSFPQTSNTLWRTRKVSWENQPKLWINTKHR